jgi:thymidylate synthase
MSKVINHSIRHDHTYLAFAKDVLANGRTKTDRTGTGTTSVFGREMRFDIRNGVIPVLTTKKMHLPSIIHEIIWYLSGTGNIKYLQENGVRIWNEWADENGDLGPVYGYQWRNCPTYALAEVDMYGDEYRDEVYTKGKVDQIAEVIETLKTNPDSRRIMVNAWNVGQLSEMNLPPCHYTFQFYSDEMTVQERIHWFMAHNPDYEYEDLTETFGIHPNHGRLDDQAVPRRFLSCKITQRSADVFLGVPFNIAQYSILTHMIAQVVGMAGRELIWSGGDCHIYSNHVNQVEQQLTRDPYTSPILVLNKSVDKIDDFTYSDISVKDYLSHPGIKAQVAV